MLSVVIGLVVAVVVSLAVAVVVGLAVVVAVSVKKIVLARYWSLPHRGREAVRISVCRTVGSFSL